MKVSALVFLLTAASSLAACTSPAGGSPNPLFAGADPHAIAVDGDYWIYPTRGGDRLTAWSSPDLDDWRERGVLIRMSEIDWIDDDGAPVHHLWAPSVVQANGRWYLYYSVGPQNPTPSRIGVAVGKQPQGPFTDIGRPLLTGGNGFEAIDPLVFVDPKTGARYLYAGGSAGATLRVFELAPDMVTIEREVEVDQPPNFTEGAFMHERGGVYYLSYSHGSWNRANYSVHYATAASPIGPWTYRGVILESDARHQGPGHHSFLRDPRDGAWLIVYHRWEQPPAKGIFKGKRWIAMEAIRYSADGAILPIEMSDQVAASTIELPPPSGPIGLLVD